MGVETVGKRSRLSIRRFLLNLMVIQFLLSPAVVFSRHSIAPAFSYTYIQTTQRDQYHFTSPALNYTGDLKMWNYRLYLSVSMLFPVWASQNGRSCDIHQYYTSTVGADLFVGISRDFEVFNHFGIEPVLGWHQNGIRLQAKSRYVNFYSMTSGLSFNLFSRFRGRQTLLNFAFLSIAMDFVDQLYTENRLNKGYTLTIGIGHTF